MQFSEHFFPCFSISVFHGFAVMKFVFSVKSKVTDKFLKLIHMNKTVQLRLFYKQYYCVFDFEQEQKS